ncbi:hypothetical protein MCAMS1_01795 [biofilm metagenome]
MSEAKTRQKLPQKRNLLFVNEHFKTIFNDVFASAIVKQQPNKVSVTIKAMQSNYYGEKNRA